MKKYRLSIVIFYLLIVTLAYCDDYSKDLDNALAVILDADIKVDPQKMKEAQKMLLEISHKYEPKAQVDLMILNIDILISGLDETQIHFNNAINKYSDNAILGYIYYSMGIYLYLDNQQEYKRYFEMAIDSFKASEKQVERFRTTISSYIFLNKHSEAKKYFDENISNFDEKYYEQIIGLLDLTAEEYCKHIKGNRDKFREEL